MATAEPPLCGICEQPMRLLATRTAKKELEVFVCYEGKAADRRIPCDGDAFRIATKDDDSVE